VPSLWLALSEFLNPDRGPQQTGDFEVDPSFFFVLLVLGFIIGVIGHIARSRAVVAVGVTLIFLATVALPIALNVAK
jgi:hypothetical protein